MNVKGEQKPPEGVLLFPHCLSGFFSYFLERTSVGRRTFLLLKNCEECGQMIFFIQKQLRSTNFSHSCEFLTFNQKYLNEDLEQQNGKAKDLQMSFRGMVYS